MKNLTFTLIASMLLTACISPQYSVYPSTEVVTPESQQKEHPHFPGVPHYMLPFPVPLPFYPYINKFNFKFNYDS